MLRFLLIILGLASYASCSNHTLFRTCAKIPFCNKLRNYQQPSPFKADISKWSANDKVATIPLKNAENISLNLQIAFLTDRTARVQIEETDVSRFELIYVLQKNPEKINFKATLTTKNLTLAPLVTKYTQRVVIVPTDTSFDVKFYFDNILQFVLKGDRLVFLKDSQAFAFATQFNATHLYGLHHHAVDLELPATNGKDEDKDPYRNRNSDNDNYEINSRMALYGSIPVIYGHSKDQTYGIFLHNAAEQWIDISVDGDDSRTSYFMVESGLLDFFVFFGNEPKDVVRQYTGLTGVAHMPQLWTLGYHQCRWSYLTQDITKDVVANMDRHNFPMDAIWLDIDYTDGQRYFTWNPKTYPNPEDLQRNLSLTNRKLVTILDPHIKVDEDYPVYVGAKNQYFVKLGDKDYTADCWPGNSSWMDFMNPEARDYYASWYHYDKFNHSTPTLAGIWNDMNEPSVFDNSIEKTLPFETLHYGNVSHRDIHNIYGFLHTMATHQGLLERDNNKTRPFILTRSHFAGSQRFAAMWTGDNTADWPYLKLSYSECLLSNILGHVFCGADVGGFFGNTTDELMQRWHQAAIWIPFYRGHAETTTKNREPYLFPDAVQDVIRKAMNVRYKHIPVWYTLFYEHTRTGEPIIRPIFYEYPGTVQSEHLLLGSNILARPVMEKGAKKLTVNFPGREYIYWYRVDDDSFKVYLGGSSQELDVDITTSPYFYKGGSIIARKNTERRSTTEMQNDPFTLYVNLDAYGQAKGTLYVDDYTSFKYQEEQLYFYAQLTYTNHTGALQVEIIDGNGMDFEVDLQEIIVHEKSSKGDEQYTRTVHTHLADGTPLKDAKLMEKISKENRAIFKV